VNSIFSSLKAGIKIVKLVVEDARKDFVLFIIKIIVICKIVINLNYLVVKAIAT